MTSSNESYFALCGLIGDGDRSALEKFLEERAAEDNLDLNDKKHMIPMILFCIILQKKDLIDLLISYGADINRANSIGAPPLSVVVGLQDMDLLIFLLKRGANPSPPVGHPPLLQAIFHRDEKMVRCLLKRGADVNMLTSENKPIHTVPATPIIKELIEKRRKGVLSLKDLVINIIYRLQIPHDHLPETFFEK